MSYTLRLATLPGRRLAAELDRLFDDRGNAVPAEGSASWSPVTSIREETDRFILESEVPGLTPDDLQVVVEQEVLTLSGTRTTPTQAEGTRWLVTERRFGAFRRHFRLPEAVDGASIEAELSNGVLRLTLPKRPVAQPRRIDIRTA